RWPRDWSSDVCSSDLDVTITSMPLTVRLFLLSFVSATCIFAQVTDYTLKVDVPYVLIDVTVQDEHNKAVDDLSRQSFELYEDGRSEERRVGKECRYDW